MTDSSPPLLTSNGAAIPALGFGTSPMTGAFSADEVLAALRAGYRHIDTAWKYGTERAVGEAIRASGLPRQDIFLTTKVSHEYLRADDFARSVDESLAALQVDAVDLLMVHWPNPEIPLAETMAALAGAKRQGLARHIGVANFNIALLDQAIQLCPEPLVALQAEYHPYLDQSKLLAAARARGLIYVAYCPLGRGRLFGDQVLAEIAQARPLHCADRLALADAAARRRHSALVEPAAHRRQLQGVRLHAERRRDGAHLCAPARQQPHRQPGRAAGRRLGLIPTATMLDLVPSS
jgi:diketogulonate reductase-like aldo/keto reductase